MAFPCEERDLTLTEAYRADEMFCSGTMGELAAVTRQLSEMFREMTGREGTVVVDIR
jgi:branched-chain amino acid aminotransferase